MWALGIVALIIVIIIIVIVVLSVGGNGGNGAGGAGGGGGGAGGAGAGGTGGAGGGGGASGGQYVRIERVAPSTDSGPDGSTINLGEIDVIDASGNSLLAGATVSEGSVYGGSMYPGDNLIDDNNLSFFSSAPGGSPYSNIWVEIDLGTDKHIHQVNINNRIQCCNNRAIGLRLVIKNSAGNIVYTGPTISSSQPTYSFVTDL
jgi:hypothetical protein